jgi:GGDEF domain-containing protein
VLADYNEWRDSIYPDDLEFAERSLAQVLLKGAVEDREYRILNADGQLRWLSDKCYINQQHVGDRVIIVGIAEDITEKKQLEGELQRLATTDVLTQSSNRRHFFECAQQAFDSAREDGTPLAFLLLDIDDFKASTTATATRKATRYCNASPTAARPCYAVATCSGALAARSLPPCSRLQYAGGRADCRTLAAADPALSFSHGEQTYGVTVSQGLTGLTEEDVALDSLYARADAAMYQAKRQGKNQIVTADPSCA